MNRVLIERGAITQVGVVFKSELLDDKTQSTLDMVGDFSSDQLLRAQEVFRNRAWRYMAAEDALDRLLLVQQRLGRYLLAYLWKGGIQ